MNKNETFRSQRTAGVATVARSDYGIYIPILKKIQADRDLRLHLIVSGVHLDSEADGFPISDRVKISYSSDSPEGIAQSMAEGLAGFAKSFQKFRPDILLVLGDRFEMHVAALAALPFKIPVAHIHGGELTEGAFDDALRHSITKLSHLHFVSTEEYAKRVIQMGEEPWRVTVSGAPGLDHLQSIQFMKAEELNTKHHLKISEPPLLVTFHPVTLEYEKTEWQIKELLSALETSGFPVVFTMPNADTNNRIIRREIENFVKKHLSAQAVENLGTQDYFSLMSLAAAMIGNSSSGIIEAASFKLPVVNIGTRQDGRIRARNVIDVGYSKNEILEGIRQATDKEFRESLKGLTNVYGDGNASGRIVGFLKQVALDDRLIRKRFNKKPRCVILGGGGHARVLIDCLQTSGVAEPYAILDSDPSKKGKELLGIPILGGDDLLPQLAGRGVTHFVVGLGSTGDNRPRQHLFERGLSHHLEPLTVIHPSAVCSKEAKIGRGSQLFPRSVVNAGSEVGENVIVNSGAIVEHDCLIGDHTHIATGAQLASAVRVGKGAHIGIGASVKQGVTIGEGAVVGAGAVVVKDVLPHVVVIGVPAHPQSERIKN